MGYLGKQPTAVPLSGADIVDDSIESADIKAGTIVNSDVNASAAIATSKVSGAVTSIASHGLATSATTDTTNAANIGSGTLPDARFPAVLPASSGANLTSLPTSLDATPDTDHTANGPQTNTVAAGYTSVLMDLVYLGTGGKWLEAQADATARSISLLGIALEVKNDTQAMNVALSGSFIADASWTWAVGVPLYISGTLGAITATKPTTSGHVVRTVGYSLSATTIFFNPSSDYVTLA